MKFESEEQELEYYKKYFEEGKNFIKWINRKAGLFTWGTSVFLILPKKMGMYVCEIADIK